MHLNDNILLQIKYGNIINLIGSTENLTELIISNDEKMIGIRIGDNVIGIDSGIFDELSELNEAANTSVLQKASNERFQSISNDFIQKDGIFISRSNKKNRILKEFTSPNEDFIKSKKESAKKIYMKWQKDFITKDLRDGPLENSSIPKKFFR